MSTGKKIYQLIEELWSINRSLTGNGNRTTLYKLKKINPKLKKFEVLSGKKVFDWQIPLEWNVKEAYLKDLVTKKIIADFNKNNLHLMGYSRSINKILNFSRLKKKLNFIKSLPDAIPYTTSYYNRDWGFNISFNEFKKINRKNNYLAFIKTELKKGSMSYGEILIKGKIKKEILISTYICHPSMANNELSGPALSIYLSKWIAQKKNNKFTYRFLFIPETIGSINYISSKFQELKENVMGILNLTCVGDNKVTSFLPTKYENTFLDKLVINYFNKKDIKFKKYNWKDRGSDERQYMSALVNLPTVSIMSSKYHSYKEYHTSKDDLKFINIKGLSKNYKIHKELIEKIEKLDFPKTNIICEPNLGKRKLYPTKSHFLRKKNKLKKKSKDLLNFLSYSDGKNTLEDISEYTNNSLHYTKKIYKELLNNNLLEK